jgi:hypothetical protein
MSKLESNMCKIKLKEQIECKSSIMYTGRHYTCQVEQEWYDKLGVYGNRFVTSIDPKIRSNTLNLDIIKTNIK